MTDWLDDVLVVNDDPHVRSLLATVVESKFHVSVRHAANGIEALSAVRQKRPALILLDLNMPKMDGFDAFRCLQSWQDAESVPVIVVTGMPLHDLRWLAEQTPVYSLADGFDLPRMVDMIAQNTNLALA